VGDTMPPISDAGVLMTTIMTIMRQGAPEPSQWDIENLDLIMSGHGDWFSAELFRLMRKTDAKNRKRLGVAFPFHMEAYYRWESYAVTDKDYSFPLTGKTVVLGQGFKDPDRGLVVPGKTAYVEGLWIDLTGKTLVDSSLEGNMAAVMAVRRFASMDTIGTVSPDKDAPMIYIKIDVALLTGSVGPTNSHQKSSLDLNMRSQQ